MSGATVSAFAAVSLEPPLVSLNLARTSQTLDAIQASRTFSVAILCETQVELARRFSSASAEKCAGVDDEHTPLLDGALARIQCRLWTTVPAGDHVVVIGEVIGGRAHEGRPLLHHRGAFSTCTVEED